MQEKRENILKAIRHFQCMADDARVVLDSEFGTHSGESDLIYRNRKMYAELAIEALKKELSGGWIPVNEHLPEPSNINQTTGQAQKYLCILDMGEEKKVDLLYYTATGFWAMGRNYSDKVIAWQPMPGIWEDEPCTGNSNIGQGVVPRENPERPAESTRPAFVTFPSAAEDKKAERERQVARAQGFGAFWDAYPKKMNRQMAMQSYIGLLGTTPTLTDEVLLRAAENYADACRVRQTREQYIKNPENWLDNGTWLDYIQENYKRPEPPENPQRKNQFNNFSQREYTEGQYQSIEQKLLNRR